MYFSWVRKVIFVYNTPFNYTSKRNQKNWTNQERAGAATPGTFIILWKDTLEQCARINPRFDPSICLGRNASPNDDERRLEELDKVTNIFSFLQSIFLTKAVNHWRSRCINFIFIFIEIFFGGFLFFSSCKSRNKTSSGEPGNF